MRIRRTNLLVFLVIASSLTLFSQSNRWLANTSEWNDNSNWSNAVPSAILSALVSVTGPAPIVPVPAADTARVNDLEIQQGGELYFEQDGILIVHGSRLRITPHGSIFLGGGRLISRADITFFNEGTFAADSGVLEFSGVTWENKSGSTFDAGTSTVVFNGTGSQTLIIDSASSFTFNNLVIASAGTLTINGAVTVTGDCELMAGSSVYISAGGSFTVEGTFIGDQNAISGEGSSSLPVQLSSFTVSAQRLAAELRWSTETEVNNYGFEIERREIARNDGVNSTSAWSLVGFVTGAGTSSSPKAYAFADRGIPPGRYAYRLKQIDFDGAFAYYSASEIEIGLAPKELMLGANYPNPFNPTTNIEFTIPEPGKATLLVFNMIGQHVATLFDGPAEGGRIYQVNFSGSTLPSGLYFYKLEYGNQSAVKRMLLVK